jgi:hypothetical protein
MHGWAALAIGMGLGLGATSGALATDKAARQPAGSTQTVQAITPAGTRISTRAEGIACETLAEALEARFEALQQAIRAHDVEMKRGQDDGELIAARGAVLDARNHEAVEAFNQSVDAHNAEGERLNRISQDIEARLGAYNQDNNDRNKRCAGLVLNTPDYEVVKKMRADFARSKAAAKAAAAASAPGRPDEASRP